MSDVIKLDDGNRIGRPSQKILMCLKPTDWVQTGTLRKTAEVSQNSQVMYRVEEHLIPAGLVEEQKRRTEQDTRRFRLTRSGEAWVEAHRSEIGTPATREETQELAHHAAEEAQSAKSSVQRYRKKVHRLKQRLGELEDVEERIESIETSIEYHSGSLNGLRERKADEKDLEELQEQLTASEQQREDAFDHHRQRLDGLEMGIDEVREEIAQLRQENEQLRSELAEMKEWRNQNPVRRLFDDD